MKNNKNQITKHHIIPKKASWLDVPDNIIQLTRWVHEAHHHLFWPWTPLSQLKYLYKVNQSVLVDEVKDIIYSIISTPEEYIYKCKVASKF